MKTRSMSRAAATHSSGSARSRRSKRSARTAGRRWWYVARTCAPRSCRRRTSAVPTRPAPPATRTFLPASISDRPCEEAACLDAVRSCRPLEVVGLLLVLVRVRAEPVPRLAQARAEVGARAIAEAALGLVDVHHAARE